MDAHLSRNKGVGARGLPRREFLKYTAAAGALTAASGVVPASAQPRRTRVADFPFDEATIAELQSAMESGDVTAQELAEAYIGRIEEIDFNGPRLNSVMEINPEAVAIAAQLDAERAQGNVRGPLHGIPMLIKENIDTADQMETTAGSLALLGSRPSQDAFVAERLRAAGAVILGKTNLSEWANFRSFHSSSGWSGRAGQALNPYFLDHNPCGSSSGSGTAISANLAAASLGTETDGSIVCPSATTGLVGIKPTLGLTSRSGVIPIAHSQDVVGPMGRTVADAAAVLGPLTGVDPRDPATAASEGNSFEDYTRFLDPDGLQGARIGVWRAGLFGNSEETDAIMEEAIAAIAAAGATVVDPTDIPTANDIGGPEFTVLLFEFKADLNAYLSTRPGTPQTLAELIQFNIDNADRELTYFGQEIFLLAQESGPLTDPEYLRALRRSKRLAQDEGIDKVMSENNLDAIVAPTGSPAWPTDLINGDHFILGSSSPAAVAGYPNITVPAGFSFGLPVGISFFGRAWSERRLISLTYAFEQATQVRAKPTFAPTVGTEDFRPR